MDLFRKPLGLHGASAKRSLRAVSMPELVILAFLFVALPLFEAPKNIFSGLLIIAYLVRSTMLRDFGRASPFEMPIWILLALTLIAPLTSEYAAQLDLLESAQWWLVIGLTAIVAGRLVYTPTQLRILLAAVIIGGVWGVVDSFWVWSQNGKVYPEFRSVGHVNPSALYMLNVLAAGFAALLTDKRWVQALGIAGIVAAFAYFFPSRSLVAMASALVVTTLGIVIVLKQRLSARAILGSALGVLIGFMALFATPLATNFRNELIADVTSGGLGASEYSLLSERDSLLLTALEVYDRNPLFGTGLRSFHIATDPEVVRAELEADGRDFDAEADRFFFSSHGHNLWTTTLIERGLVGVVTVTVFLVMVFAVFTRPAFAGAGVPSDQKIAATLGFLIVTYITFAGLGQTTTYVEHGQTGMILLSVAWGALAASRADATTP